jgi:hypothetical protein
MPHKCETYLKMTTENYRLWKLNFSGALRKKKRKKLHDQKLAISNRNEISSFLYTMKNMC